FLVDVCPAEENLESRAEENQVGGLPPPTAPEPTEHITPSSTDVEPASERRDLESPITQQPEPHHEEIPPPSTEQSKAAAPEEEEAVGSGESCRKTEAPMLRVDDADHRVLHRHNLNIPQIITTPEPESNTLMVPEL
ncbi:hypothetical protein ILYODFUR_031697, partial [Ilyodon furcidens]